MHYTVHIYVYYRLYIGYIFTYIKTSRDIRRDFLKQTSPSAHPELQGIRILDNSRSNSGNSKSDRPNPASITWFSDLCPLIGAELWRQARTETGSARGTSSQSDLERERKRVHSTARDAPHTSPTHSTGTHI